MLRQNRPWARPRGGKEARPPLAGRGRLWYNGGGDFCQWEETRMKRWWALLLAALLALPIGAPAEKLAAFPAALRVKYQVK